MDNFFANLNEKMIKFVDSKKNLIAKIVFGIILFIPIALTFIVAIIIINKSGRNGQGNKVDITKDKNPDLYSSRDEKGTDKVILSDDTRNKINEMMND